MTVSDWGSAAAPFGAPGIQQGRYGQIHAQGQTYVQRPQAAQQGGPDPRYEPHSHSHSHSHSHGEARASAPGGYPAPEPYGGPQPRPQFAAQASRQATGPGAGYGAGYEAGHGAAPGSPRAAPHRRAQAVTPAGPAALNIVGALVSLVLVVGLGVWGYKLAVRDVTGVPVVKALEGPMRIQPEEPGGIVAPHQGLAVNDVAAVGASTAPVDQLRLAPPVAELAEEDVPAHPNALAESPTPTEVTRSAESPATAPLPSNGGEINADAAVAEALGLTDIPGLDAPAAPVTSAAPAGAAPLEVIPESVPGVARSPRPMPKPAGFAPLPEITGVIEAVNVSAAADQPAPARPGDSGAAAPGVALGQEIDPAAVDPAARLVQLGAFKNPDEARLGWQEIAAQNPELFNNRNWTIERHEAGGTPFYRLRALGFDGLQEARAFCAALVAAQGTCVPVVDTASETVIN